MFNTRRRFHANYGSRGKTIKEHNRKHRNISKYINKSKVNLYEITAAEALKLLRLARTARHNRYSAKLDLRRAELHLSF